MREQYVAESEHQKWLHITAVMAWVVGVLMGTLIGWSLAKERIAEAQRTAMNPPIRLECPKS